MKKPSIRPVLTVTAACLLPAVVHAQTTLQSPPGGILGESAAQPAGQSAATPMSTPMGVDMTVPVSPAQSISQPFPPVSAAATQREGLTFKARAGIERDSNVTRVSAGRISDTITGYGVGLRYQKRLSQQQFVVDVDADRYHYDNLNADYSTLNYAAAWMFRFGNRIDGTASAGRRQFRDVTQNGTAGIINRRTERNELLEGGYRLDPRNRVIAGLQRSSITSSDPLSWDGNQTQTSVRLGYAHELPTGSSLTARARFGDGEYRTLPGSDFEDREFDVTTRWVVSPRTSVDARLGHLSRDHSGALAGFDFDGMVGAINVNWDITGKTSLRAGYARDLGSYLSAAATAGHLESDRWYVAPVWRATELTSVTLRYEHETRRFVGVDVGADVGRRDRFNVLALGVDWQVRRTIAVSAQIRNERRSSTLPAFNYRANVIGLSARLTI